VSLTAELDFSLQILTKILHGESLASLLEEKMAFELAEFLHGISVAFSITIMVRRAGLIRKRRTKDKRRLFSRTSFTWSRVVLVLFGNVQHLLELALEIEHECSQEELCLAIDIEGSNLIGYCFQISQCSIASAGFFSSEENPISSRLYSTPLHIPLIDSKM